MLRTILVASSSRFQISVDGEVIKILSKRSKALTHNRHFPKNLNRQKYGCEIPNISVIIVINVHTEVRNDPCRTDGVDYLYIAKMASALRRELHYITCVIRIW